MNVTKELTKQARRLDICQEWGDQLSQTKDKQQMIDMYLRGLDFCLNNNYPSNEFIKKHFGELATKNGILVDDKFHLVVSNYRNVVCLGDAHGELHAGGYDVCGIYLKHQAKVKIYARVNSFLVIDLFDQADVTILVADNAKVLLNDYENGRYKVKKFGNGSIKIVEKQKKKY